MGVPVAHAAETASLAAVVGWANLSVSVLLTCELCFRDVRNLLIIVTLLFYANVFVAVATPIPFKTTSMTLIPAFFSLSFLIFGVYQCSDFDKADNAVFVWLLLVGLGTAFCAAVAAHWRTRETLVEKVSKAEKKIATARRWFFLPSNNAA